MRQKCKLMIVHYGMLKAPYKRWYPIIFSYFSIKTYYVIAILIRSNSPLYFLYEYPQHTFLGKK